MLELGRWGMNFEEAEDVAGLAPTSLPNALRVMLRPPADAELTLGLRSGGHSFRLRIADGWIEASRGEPLRRRPDAGRGAVRRLGGDRQRPRRRARARDPG